MKTNRIGCVILGLALVVTAFSCRTADALPPKDPPPKGPPASEVIAKMDGANFWVVFDAETKSGARSEEFSWIKVGTTNRWDLITARDGLSGEMTLKDRSDGAGWTCLWVITNDVLADSTCFDYPWTSATLSALVDQLAAGIRRLPKDAGPVAVREVLGTEAFCYDTPQLLPVQGHLCMSADGVPLEIDARSVIAAGGFEIHAVAASMRASPVDGEWKMRVSEVAKQRDASPTSLHFLDLPLSSKWMSEAH